MAQSSLEATEEMFKHQHLKVLQQAIFPTQGKMNLYFCVVLIILLCLSSRYSSVEIRLELQKNILKFGYGMNYKYKGMLAHSFDRFYMVT